MYWIMEEFMPKGIVKNIRDYSEQAFRGVVSSMILVPTGTKTASLHSTESARERTQVETGETRVKASLHLFPLMSNHTEHTPLQQQKQKHMNMW